MPLSVRSATPADFEAFYGKPPPKICVARLAERDGEVIAMGGFAWVPGQAAVGFFDKRVDVPPLVMHRAALVLIDALRWAGEVVIRVVCEPEIEGAEKWLHRLGFVPVEGTANEWLLDLAAGR